MKAITIALPSVVGLGLVLGAAATGCGNGGSQLPATSSGLSRMAAVDSLTLTQLAALCDWSAGRQGGYGHVVQCGDGGSAGPYQDQMACVENVDFYSASCPTLTVGDSENCINALAVDPCSVATNDGCAALRQCLAGP